MFCDDSSWNVLIKKINMLESMIFKKTCQCWEILSTGCYLKKKNKRGEIPANGPRRIGEWPDVSIDSYEKESRQCVPGEENQRHDEDVAGKVLKVMRRCVVELISSNFIYFF